MMSHMTLLQDGSVFLHPIQALKHWIRDNSTQIGKMQNCASLYIYFFRDFPISTSMQNRFSNATFDDTGEIHVKLSMKKPRVRPVEPLFPSCISSQNWGNWGIVINFNVSHEVGMTIPQYKRSRQLIFYIQDIFKKISPRYSYPLVN